MADEFVSLGAAGDKTPWVAIPRGEFNLHVVCAADDVWAPYVSYDGGATREKLDNFTGPNKLTPTEGDSMTSGGVLWQVEAITINTGPMKARVSS